MLRLCFIFFAVSYFTLVQPQQIWPELTKSPGDMAMKAKVLVTQSCLTLYESMDYSLPASSVHGILQGRILEWDTISSSMGGLSKP